MKIKDNYIIIEDFEFEEFFRLSIIRNNLFNSILKIQDKEVKWEDITVIIPNNIMGIKVETGE